MKFSIITPCYNSEKYIEETIKSVISQAGDFEIEYIIIDGKSTDKTLDIVKKYKNMLENNLYEIKCNNITLKYISKFDNSMYEALSTGLKMISGDIVAYINSDDRYISNAFKCINNLFTNTEIKWVTGRNSIMNEQGTLVESFLPLRYKNNYIKYGLYGRILPSIQQESTFWRCELNTLINFDKLETFKLAGDGYIWNCFASEYKLDIIGAGLGVFRMRADQLSTAKDKYMKEMEVICDNKNKYNLQAEFENILWKLPTKIKLKINKNIIMLKLRG